MIYETGSVEHFSVVIWVFFYFNFFHICSYNVVKQSIDVLLEIRTVYIKTQYRLVLFNKRIDKMIYLSSLTLQYNFKY